MSMEPVLLVIIALQFGYIVFKDVKVGQEREKMFLKLMSKDLREYRDSIETIADESTKQEPDVHVPVEDVSYEDILKAK
jgi:hypothetical protein